MAKYFLSAGAVKAVHSAIETLFEKCKARLLGRPLPKQIAFNTKVLDYDEKHSLPGVFIAASIEERNKPNPELIDSLNRVTESYLDSYKEYAKAKTVVAVDSFLKQAETKNVDTDVETVLGGELELLWGDLTTKMDRLANAEATVARNTGTLDGITKVAAASNITDPVVYFVVVHDDELCKECQRLHLMPDGVTPRCWYLSEVGQGYHKRGEEDPKVAGLHPHCRCSIVYLAPGYGFDGSGLVTFIDFGHDEIKSQW